MLETAGGVQATVALLAAREEHLYYPPSFCGEKGRPMGLNWTRFAHAARESANALRASAVDLSAINRALLLSTGSEQQSALQHEKQALQQLASGQRASPPPPPTSTPTQDPTLPFPWVPSGSCARAFPRRLDGTFCGQLTPQAGVADASACQAVRALSLLPPHPHKPLCQPDRVASTVGR